MGLRPDLSCPPWQPGPPPVVTPAHADAHTHAGRKPSRAGHREGPGAAGRARSRLRGRSPCRQDDVRKVREVLGAGEAWGPPASPSASAHRCPRGQGQAWASALHRRALWTSGGLARLLTQDARWLAPGVCTLWRGGVELGNTRHVGSSLRTLPLLEDRPSSPFVQARQLWSLGDSSRRGARSCWHQGQGQGSPPPAAGTAHPAAPLLLPLCVCLASRARSRSLCLSAVWPAGQGGSLGPPAPQWWRLRGGRV